MSSAGADRAELLPKVADVAPSAAGASLKAGNGAAALRVQGVTHTYPAARPRRRRNSAAATAPVAPGPALDNLSLEVQPGQIFGILGPNGSGKTTLFRILTTTLRPDAGGAFIFGRSLAGEPEAVRQQLGVVFQAPSLDGKLTAHENLLHQGHLYGLAGHELANRIEELLRRFGMSERQSEFVERFSGGMRRRVELAKALLHRPRLLLLDEPATGLDPGARIDLWRQLQELRDRHGVTIILTTHLMDEADRCDRLAILARGRLVAVDSPAALKARIGGDVITIEPELSAGGDAAALAARITERFAPWPAGTAPAVVEGKVRLEKPDGAAFVATLAAALPGAIRSITVGRPTLEDVFVHLTGHTLWEAD